MEQSLGASWKISDALDQPGKSFYETPSGKYGIAFYNIDEYGMMKYFSPVRIWANKPKPKVLFDSKNIRFEYQFRRSFYYLIHSEIFVFLLPHITDTKIEFENVLLDLGKSRFSTMDVLNYDLIERTKGEIILKFNSRYSYDKDTEKLMAAKDNQVIDLKSLKWSEVSRLGILL